jgi:hydroxymethylbilane synthase
MGTLYKIGTRSSPLALKQVEEILDALIGFHPAIKTQIVSIDTYGDRDKNTPISDVEGSDFFTKEIDEALLRGEIDFAVHSAKDLPDSLREGLIIVAITNGIDSHDVLVSKRDLKQAKERGVEKVQAGFKRRRYKRKYRGAFNQAG